MGADVWACFSVVGWRGGNVLISGVGVTVGELDSVVCVVLSCDVRLPRSSEELDGDAVGTLPVWRESFLSTGGTMNGWSQRGQRSSFPTRLSGTISTCPVGHLIRSGIAWTGGRRKLPAELPPAIQFASVVHCGQRADWRAVFVGCV